MSKFLKELVSDLRTECHRYGKKISMRDSFHACQRAKNLAVVQPSMLSGEIEASIIANALDDLGIPDPEMENGDDS